MRNITKGIGSIKRGKYEKGRGTERNPKEEDIYFTGISKLEEKFVQSVSFYFYSVFSDIYKHVYS